MHVIIQTYPPCQKWEAKTITILARLTQTLHAGLKTYPSPYDLKL